MTEEQFNALSNSTHKRLTEQSSERDALKRKIKELEIEVSNNYSEIQDLQGDLYKALKVIDVMFNYEDKSRKEQLEAVDLYMELQSKYNLKNENL